MKNKLIIQILKMAEDNIYKERMMEIIMYILNIGGTTLVHVLLLITILILTAIIVFCGITLIIALGSILLSIAIFMIVLMYLTGSMVSLQTCEN